MCMDVTCTCLMRPRADVTEAKEHDSLPLQLALQRCSRVLNLALHSWVEARCHCMDRQVLEAFDARCRQSQCAHYARNAWD